MDIQSHILKLVKDVAQNIPDIQNYVELSHLNRECPNSQFIKRMQQELATANADKNNALSEMEKSMNLQASLMVLVHELSTVFHDHTHFLRTLVLRSNIPHANEILEAQNNILEWTNSLTERWMILQEDPKAFEEMASAFGMALRQGSFVFQGLELKDMQDSGIFKQTLAIKYEPESSTDLLPEDEGKGEEKQHGGEKEEKNHTETDSHLEGG